MTQALTGLKQIMICREVTYGTNNSISTASGNASAANRWEDTNFGLTLIDGSSEDGTYFVDGYYLIPQSGTAANIGLTRKINSWEAADDEWEVTEAWPSTPQSGDTALLVKFLRANVTNLKPARAKLPRDYQSLGFTKPSPINGKPMADIEFTTEFIAHLTDGALAELFLATLGTELQAADSSAIVAGGSTSQLFVTENDESKFAVGGLIAVLQDDNTYAFAAVTAKAEADASLYDTLNITPALSGYPSAGKTVKAMRCFSDAETGQIGLTIIVQNNAERWVFAGCRGSVALNEINTGNIPELNFSFKANQPTLTTSALSGNAQLPDIEPPSNFNGYARINGSDYEMYKFSADLGNQITEKPIFEGTYGRKEWSKTGHDIKASFGIFNNAAASNAEWDLHDSNTTADLFVVSGSPANSAGCVAVRLPTTKINDATLGDEEGRATYEMEAGLFDNEITAASVTRVVFGYTT